jgi:uncharacterized RDD family membrane protein YckC
VGLIDVYQQARLPAETNLLVVVDQFEELFRYRDLAGADTYGAGYGANSFVRLLLEAVAQREYPIYVALTMRSDFLGDCSQFDGLAEAISESQYLVPRMTREERRAAVEGPIAVADGAISPVLLTRLVNDVGDSPDQLSILQHAMNRTWARWQNEGCYQGSLSLEHYEAIGAMSEALDRHAEKAYKELTGVRQAQICERVFKALTDRGTDPRGIRRPMKLAKLCEVAGASEAEVMEVIAVFRKSSRSFLMPGEAERIGPETVIDISHESLMRVWTRLKKWANEEAEAAREYRRLADRAAGYLSKRFGLMQDPDLQTALDFKRRQEPTPAWTELYGGGINDALEFLHQSETKRDAEKAEHELEQRWQRLWQPVLFTMAALSFLIVLVMKRDALLPAYRDLSQSKLGQGWDVVIGFGKITLLVLPFAAAYEAAIRFGKRLHRRFALPRILEALRNPKKEAAREDSGIERDPAAAVGTTYARWWRRSVAALIDSLVGFVLAGLMIFFLALIELLLRQISTSPDMSLFIYPAWLLSVCLYHVFTVGSRWKATFGMLAVRVYVTDLNGTRLSRWAVVRRQMIKFVLLPVSCYWPVIYFPAKWISADRRFVRRRQWLSDILSKTVVLVRTPKRAPAFENAALPATGIRLTT